MKKIILLSIYTLLLCPIFILSSCENDDEIERMELTRYKWLYKYYDAMLYDPDDYELSIQADKTWLYFLPDGTGVMSCRLTDYDTFFGTKREEVAYRFSYSVYNNRINLSFNDSKLNRVLSFSESCLIDSNDRVYERLTFSSSEINQAIELADEIEFQASINHDKVQDISYSANFDKFAYPYLVDRTYVWSISAICNIQEDSYRYGIFLAGLVLYIDDGTITNRTGRDSNSGENVKKVTLDGKTSYYFENVVGNTVESANSKWSSVVLVESKQNKALTIHYALRYYDSVSDKYFMTSSRSYVYNNTTTDVGNTDKDAEEPNTSVFSGSHNGHAYVDLGLSVKWATSNVDALTLEGYGGYYAWGETKTKSIYNWGTYKLCDGDWNRINKYCLHSSCGSVDNKKVLGASDDIATVKWGGKWRMPTSEEMEELLSKCSWKLTTLNGVKGWRVTGTTGNAIFLPASGLYIDDHINGKDLYCHYWTSSLSVSWSTDGKKLTTGSDYTKLLGDKRYYGASIRAVCK